MEESPRERAISLEPSCSNRRNPFEEDDAEEQTSRKRQRLSRSESRSRSVDTTRNTDIVPDSMLRRESPHKAEAGEPPSTPTRLPFEQAEPTSRVTINLRTRNLESIPSSPPSPTPPNMLNGGEEAETRISVESESDALSTVQAIETPSSSSSAISSPEVEFLPIEDDDDHNPAVAIINDSTIYSDPLLNFPYFAEGEPLCHTLQRVARFLQYDEISDDLAFSKIRDWIERCLLTHSQLDQFYELYTRDREFWTELPNLIWALSYRSRFFGEFLRRVQESRLIFSDMMLQFARLTGKVAAMDARTLQNHAVTTHDQDPDVVSRPYLHALLFLFNKNESSHIGRNLETHYQWDWDEEITAMSEGFQNQGGDIRTLTNLVKGYLNRMAPNPKLIESCTEPCRLVSRAVSDIAHTHHHNSDMPHSYTTGEAQQKALDGFDFFKVMSAGLEVIIDKHVTFLSPDSAHVYLSHLYDIFKCVLGYDAPAIREVFDSHTGDRSRLSQRQWPKVISLEWKFTILKKLITSTQMQLRVVGVTTMCSDLVNLYSTHNKGVEASNNPILLYFADFILANQLVDYIVGIGSHPEIINESNNILGFLVVTKTYKSAQTDKIWQTVMTSQDPRVVEAILKMLTKCLHLYDYRSLLYLCKKLTDVPIESFTPVMREFCTSLFTKLVEKAGQEGNSYLGPAPYYLCLRLVKESSITLSDGSLRSVDVHGFANRTLANLLPHGPGTEVRKEIYHNCIQDISARTPTAAGSICIINILLKHNTTSDLHALTVKQGLTQLLVEDLEASFLENSADKDTKNSPANQARRELLLGIIVNEPSTISPELGQRLWDVLVGTRSKSAAERDTSWQILNNAVKRASSSNVFIASCFQNYLPMLPPQCFTQGALDFAREAVHYWLEEVRTDVSDQDQTFESQALEQIWRMILTAPPETIDATAISMLVEVYVDSALILNMPRFKARTIHLALVDRCLKQLKGAAAKLKVFNGDASSGSDEAMVIVASEDEFAEQETIFARSLAVLKGFLTAYQSKPQFATPKSRSPITGTSSTVEGEPMTVKYQSFDGDKHTEVRSLTLGKLNTAATLFASLQKATGFKNYKVYCAGKEFDPDEIEVCKSLDDLKLNGLVLVQRREDADALPAHLNSNKPTLEAEITKHFDDLWSYLSMHDKVAQEIYYFLTQFPVYDRLIGHFEVDTTYSEIFPTGQPYKSLYALHALREYVVVQLRKVNISSTEPEDAAHVTKRTSGEIALTRATSLIVAAISDPDVLSQCAADNLRGSLALQMLDCLIKFLRGKSVQCIKELQLTVTEPLLPPSIAPLLNETLLQRLLVILYEAKGVETAQNSDHLTWRSFEAILEASTHNSELWTAFSDHIRSTPLLRQLIFEDSRPNVRRSVVKQIMNKSVYSSSLAQVSTTTFATTFWPMVAGLIPEAVLNSRQCEETLSLALTLFKRIAETSLEFLNLEELVKNWGSLLLQHSCVERVGHPESVDLVAQGLSHLLFCAASFAKASQQRLSCGAIGTKLFRKHMFPELSLDNDEDDVISPSLPLLNPATRCTLSETVFSLIKDDETQYKSVLKDLLALVPYEKIDDGPYIYEMAFQFDRSKAIRSPTGYVGLKNLSNTCYLNSLFTQLYMNIPFREFMLGANVADGSSQKLLSETQNIFSYMQNSLKRYVDPANLASSIRTYEETPIDVTVQMDVDEFYNLLFDRWESQILAEEAKKKFRLFYGGELVQQVKSKECPHISERLESFSAIQCDIKGKSCLQESLQAYVDGEVMEGDNKYKCSTCDRHVDAVKRACLKDVADNLIFHLKRFDFNLRTLQRSKINDHFSFPTKIDMRPYKVEYLMDNAEETPEDIFELVGVLVHAGTAESGHYYSFIRERPSNDEKETWLEFNDDSVTPWDPSCMESSCFGGTDYRSAIDSGNLPYDKTWSAYMLFYQRSTVVAAQKEALLKSGLSSPVRLPIPVRLSNHIAMENEILMRRYCLYDPSHAPFVTKMLSNIRKVNGGNCSASHSLEKLALTASLNHLDQVIARAKDLPDFQPFMLALKQICSSCGECSRDYLEWFIENPETLRQLLLRNPEGLVRSEIAASINAALDMVNSDASYAYGFEDDEDSAEELEGGDPQLIQRIVHSLSKLWDIFHSNCRAWPEYFGLLASIASRGKLEATLLLDAGFLRKTLEIVSADSMLPITQQYQRMLAIISKRLTTRPVSFDAVLTLLSTLIKVCDPALDPINDDKERWRLSLDDLPIPFNDSERHLLTQHWTRNSAHILVEKLLYINQNRQAVERILVDLLNWPETLDTFIMNAIIAGIRRPLNAHPCGSFLHAAYTYCVHSKSARAVFSMATTVSKIAAHSDSSEGKDFLHFFSRIYAFIASVNDNVTSKKALTTFFFDQVPVWAPSLLTNYDATVRRDTLAFLTEIMFMENMDEWSASQEDDDEREKVIALTAQKLGFACLKYVNDVYIHQRQQAVRVQLVPIEKVIESCESFFDPQDALTQDFNERRDSILPALKKFMVEEPDEDVSDWDGSDADYDESSEPLDGLPDFCGTGNDDEIQL